MARMVCLAYSGREEALASLFSNSLIGFAEPLKQSWLASACLAAGQNDEGTTRLINLRNQSDHLLRQSIERRLAHPPIIAVSVLTPESQVILNHIELEQSQEDRYQDRPRLLHSKAYATYSLIALNIAAFLVEEAAGGSENLRVLFQLGAFSHLAIAEGEAWRVITSMFLHAGIIHLAFNLLALYFIGPFVEYWLGIRRYLLTYFAAGLGGAVLTLLFSDPRQVVVGASGCIVGLIGASAAIHLRGWQTEKASVARKELLEIAVFMAIQTVLDILTPRISLTGHLGGLIAGFVIGLALLPANPIKATLKLQQD
jgi:rhomboid protease GluP